MDLTGEESSYMSNEYLLFIEKENFKRIVGDLIRENRTKIGLTQQTLGDLTDMERTYIGAIERGEKNLSFYTMYKIFKALEIDPSDFINKI